MVKAIQLIIINNRIASHRIEESVILFIKNIMFTFKHTIFNTSAMYINLFYINQNNFKEFKMLEENNSQSNQTIISRNTDEKFCSFCGKIINKDDEICSHCGARQMMYPAKKWSTLLLLCIFIPSTHRFYAGKPITAILFMITGGGFLIWWIIDIIMILTKNFKDSQGRKITS